MRSRAASRRKKKRIRKTFLIMVMMILVFVCGILLGDSKISIAGSQAQAATIGEEKICYKSVKVQEGDTLWTIADEYKGGSLSDKDDYIDEVKRLNHLNGYKISTGEYIMIPYIDQVPEQCSAEVIDSDRNEF